MKKLFSEETKRLPNKLRSIVLDMISKANSSHVGSAFSIAEIVTVLYSGILNISAKNVKENNRDRIIISKGHAVAILYAILAEKGFFPKEWLDTFYKNDTILAGHATSKHIPGIELSTGSLGHGLSVGCGMAYNSLLDDLNFRVVVLMSDGECNEGSVWEAIMFAGHHKLNNLLVIVDYNKIQSLGHTKDILDLEPFVDKWKAFRWNVKEIDGHNMDEIYNAVSVRSEMPTVIIAHTIKGKGVSFMEDTVLWHYRTPKGDELKEALIEINNQSII
jgi:transketolase